MKMTENEMRGSNPGGTRTDRSIPLPESSSERVKRDVKENRKSTGCNVVSSIVIHDFQDAP